MPSSTRQATPGPSSTLTGNKDCPVSMSNTKKRAGSEDVEDARHSKKIKVDGEPLSNLSMNAKGKKKKKKKKKKRTPVVVPEVEPKERVKPKSRTPSKPASVGRIEIITNGPVDDTKHTMANGDGKPPHLSNKGKGKARSNSPTSHVPTPTVDSKVAVASGSGDLTVILPDSVDHASEIASLKEQLALQDIILQKHKNHLAQHQQALTCQICLDLMHKPFALAPCGHITCYNCLIRWFTAFQNPNPAGAADDNANPLPENADEVQLIVNSTEAKRGTYLRRRKICPVCRAAVLQRPVEMWGIKSMVVTLVSSKLVDLPVPIAPQNSITPGGANNNDDANNDPWRYIFHPTNINARLGPLVQQIHADQEHMGMFDVEDGGIYRCIDCFHEIWGGVCSGCHRGYPGHEGDDDDNDDNDSDLLGHEVEPEFLDDEEPIPFWGEENGNLIYPMLGHLFMSSDEGMTDSEEDDDRHDIFFDAFQPAFFGPPVLGGIARVDEISDEEHESDYGGSFIDDNEEGEGENMDEVIEVNDASSDEEHSHPRQLPRIQQRRRSLVRNEDSGSNVDTDDEEANNIPAILARFSDRRSGTRSREPTRRHAAVLLTDDSRSSGEEHDEEEEALAPEDTLFRSQACWSSGEEHDEDEEELAPEDVVFRSRARLRWVFSDEE